MKKEYNKPELNKYGDLKNITRKLPKGGDGEGDWQPS